LVGNVAAVREIFLDTVDALRRRSLPTRDVCSLVRLTKTPAAYHASRSERRELPYEALLASGRSDWASGERVHVYRASGKRPALLPDDAADDARDYDTDYYLRQLREAFAARLSRALAPEHFAAVFADPAQLSLFAPSLQHARPILTVLAQATITQDGADGEN
jgi:DNA polymerase elongation subunit (family B)